MLADLSGTQIKTYPPLAETAENKPANMVQTSGASVAGRGARELLRCSA